MTIQTQIKAYISSQPEPKRSDLQVLHRHILKIMPGCKLWFLDGKNSTGKTVSNPNIGYGLQTMHYADGTTKEFYQIGLSANTTGISVYIMGLKDKNYLPRTYGKKLGKASAMPRTGGRPRQKNLRPSGVRVTGYCIKFKALKDIQVDNLEAAIRDGVGQQLAYVGACPGGGEGERLR